MHIFVMWARVAFGDTQRGHIPVFRLPHLLRLSGLAREFVDNLAANNITFLGTFLAMLCPVTNSFSSIIKFVKSPCIVSSLTLVCHSFWQCLNFYIITKVFKCHL